MAAALAERGFDIVSGGTDNHLFLLSLIGRDITGKDADAALGRAQHHGQQECGAERSAPADDHERPAPGHAGVDHARLSRSGDRARSPAGSPTFSMRAARTSAIERVRPQVVELCRRFPVYGD